QGGAIARTREVAVSASHIIHPVGTLGARWPQRHEHPEDDNADCRHQNEVAVRFHYQCLLYIEALMAIPAMPRIVPAMTCAFGGPPEAGRRPLVALIPS